MEISTEHTEPSSKPLAYLSSNQATRLDMSKVCFIVNPHSGGLRKRKDINQIISKYFDGSKRQHEIIQTEYAGHAIELSKKAVKNGFGIVVAVGGDGSINEVAQGLIGTDAVLGVIPGGSGNGFATHFGISKKINIAMDVINRGKIQRIDSVTMNGMPYVNIAGTGYSGDVAFTFKSSKNRGLVNYTRITLGKAYSIPFLPYSISVDGGEFMDRECLMIEVANSTTFGNNFKPAPLAKINDGLLELVIVNKANKLKYFASFPKMLNGKIHKASYMERYACKKVSIKVPKGSYAHLDGEGMECDEMLNFEIVPNSLNVLVP